MKQNELFRSIREGKIAIAYAFLGDEAGLKRRALAMLKAALVPEGLEAFDYEFPERQATLAELQAACDTLPYLCEKRLIVCYCDTMFQREAEGLTAYLNNFPSACCLVLWAGDGKTKLPAGLESLVTAVAFEPMDEATMARYLSREAKTAGVDLPVKLAAKLYHMAGTDIIRAENELEKFCAYVRAGHAPGEDALRTVVSPVPEYNVFRMTDLFFAGKKAEGMRLLCAMLDGGEAPLAVCGLLAARFRAMVRAKAILSGGASAEAVARSLGGSRYAARKAVEGCRKLSYETLRSAYETLLDCDVRVKSGRMPARTALEQAVAKIFAG